MKIFSCNPTHNTYMISSISIIDLVTIAIILFGLIYMAVYLAVKSALREQHQEKMDNTDDEW
ncbi:hypothetical protein NJ7G_1174 [Natrinema sp. J7-2]|nr:hypothetical protein NJ7G_1174 [Natrinema sp. J7-2]